MSSNCIQGKEVFEGGKVRVKGSALQSMCTTEPDTSGLEKTAPSGELEFSSRSN